MQFKSRSRGVFQLHISEITQRNRLWMPWSLNCDLAGGATWPSNHFWSSAYIPQRAAYVQKHRKRELRACLIGRVPTHEPRIFSRSGMLNRKFGLSCVHCVIQISQLLLLCVCALCSSVKQSKPSKKHKVQQICCDIWYG